ATILSQNKTPPGEDAGTPIRRYAHTSPHSGATAKTSVRLTKISDCARSHRLACCQSTNIARVLESVYCAAFVLAFDRPPYTLFGERSRLGNPSKNKSPILD